MWRFFLIRDIVVVDFGLEICKCAVVPNASNPCMVHTEAFNFFFF